MKLGDHRFALRERVTTGETDDYGADVVVDRYTLVRWALVMPTRAVESETRSAPAVAGLSVQAPTSARVIEAADAVIYPIAGETTAPDGSTVYEGRQWEVVGEVGEWDTYVEFQLRRTS